MNTAAAHQSFHQLYGHQWSIVPQRPYQSLQTHRYGTGSLNPVHRCLHAAGWVAGHHDKWRRLRCLDQQLKIVHASEFKNASFKPCSWCYARSNQWQKQKKEKTSALTTRSTQIYIQNWLCKDTSSSRVIKQTRTVRNQGRQPFQFWQV